MKNLCALLAVATCAAAPFAWSEEPDHAIHEELRGVLHAVVSAMNSGQYDQMLPYLTEDVEATSITQEVMSNRADVSNYFKEWFGPTGYMRRMEIKLDADKLTELSPDKRWGLVRGKALEHYEAKDGDIFDFDTRWTAVMVRGDDGKWRLRAIHFGTNDLDNPVLTKVQRTLMRYGVIAAMASLLVGLGLGWWIGQQARPARARGLVRAPPALGREVPDGIDRRERALSTYALKPRFQALLRPVTGALARAGVTANQVTVAAAVVSVALGGFVAWRLPDARAFALIPLWMVARMACNAIDGMLAREFGQRSRLGAYLNELADVVSDVALYLPFALLPPFSPCGPAS